MPYPRHDELCELVAAGIDRTACWIAAADDNGVNAVSKIPAWRAVRLELAHDATFFARFNNGTAVQLIVTSEQRVSELTRESGVTQGAVSQHLKLLKQAGLVLERPEGRNVFYRARPEGLAPLFDWLSHYDAFWRERLGDLRSLLKEIDP